MPITSITIENFKGIADRVTVPLRPITLLFGANSAGKSTILQALLYLRDLLIYRDPDAGVLSGCGHTINLGGFREYVHGHDLSRRVRISAAFTVDDDGLPEYVVAQDKNAILARAHATLDCPVKFVEVTVEVEYSPIEGPWICGYQVAINGRVAGKITGSPLEAPIVQVHPEGCLYKRLFSANDPEDLEIDSEGNSPHGHEEAETETGDEIEDDDDDDYEAGKPVDLEGMEGMAEEFYMHLSPEEACFEDLEVLPAFGKPFGPLENETFTAGIVLSGPELQEIFSQVFVGSGELLLAELERIRYIGPIRKVPSRSFYPDRSPEAGLWADGTAAWDILYSSKERPDWLREQSWAALGLGCRLEISEQLSIPKAGILGTALEKARLGLTGAVDALKSLPSDAFSSVEVRPCFRLISDEQGLPVAPHDVGVGVSQVLPVAIGAMQPGYSILAVEQPELHVHPAVQCRLADLLAAQVLPARERIMLLETHSEHLILRLLRRVRERHEGKLPEGAPALEPDDLCVLYAEMDKGKLKLTELPVTEDGDFARDWPKGFFEERFSEYPD